MEVKKPGRIFIILLARMLTVAIAFLSFPDTQAQDLLGSQPTDEEIWLLGQLPYPLEPAVASGSDDNASVAAALNAFKAGKGESNWSVLSEFADSHPESRWTPALLLNLGALYYQNGYFSRALGAWKSAWESSGALEEGPGRRIADFALAEYARMLARIGRKDELEALLESVKDRPVFISAEQVLNQAREGLLAMTLRPGTAFMCGPYALRAVGEEMGELDSDSSAAFLEGIASTDRGFSMAEVMEFARQQGIPLKAMRRGIGAQVVVPSVVHWKVGHYGALISESGGYYRLIDPTFRNDTSLTSDAIDAESSGVFLIPASMTPQGWTEVSDEELHTLFGKGHSGTANPDRTRQCDRKTGTCPKPGMPAYQIHLMLCNLSVSDMPLPQQPTAGPSLSSMLTYNHKEARQTGMAASNFGPQWVTSLVSYIIESNPSVPGAAIFLREFGGGGYEYKNYVAGSPSGYGNYEQHVDNKAYVRRLGSTGFERIYPDGSKDVYTQKVGSDRFFIKQRIDADGNALTFNYDSTPGYGGRLLSVATVEGFQTTFSYALSGGANAFLVTKIEDNWGREASFGYANGMLTSITDAVGLTSTFTYNLVGYMESMTTPYGTTSFYYGQPSISYGMIAWVEVTDPMGATERVEMNVGTATGVPKGFTGLRPSGVGVKDGDFDDRNSFHWNWKQWEEAKGAVGAAKYGKAHKYHWLEPVSSADESSGILQCEKPPLEGHIWYNYPGQAGFENVGTFALPSKIGRVLDDGSSQVYEFGYNSQGAITSLIDPEDRETIVTYYSNGTDIDTVQLKDDDGNFKTVAKFGGYTNGRPAWELDAGGYQTDYTYSSVDGQLETVTNALDEVTTYVYGTQAGTPNYRQVVQIKRRPASGAEITVATIDRQIVNQGGSILLRVTETNVDGYSVVTDYDELLRPVKTGYPDNSSEEVVYDRLSPAWIKDRNDRWTTQFHNRRGQLAAVRDPEGRWTRMDWCKCGALKSLTDGNGHTTKWDHDLQNRVVTKTYADNRKEKTVYEATRSVMARFTDAGGNIRMYDYYRDNRLKEISYANVNEAATAATPAVNFEYDAFGRFKEMVDGVGTTQASYHPVVASQLGAGRIAALDGPWSNDTITYTYDALRRPVGTDVAGAAQSWGYDYLGRRTTLTNLLGAFVPAYVGNSGRVDTLTFPNGLEADYGYYPVNHNLRVQDVLYRTGGGSQIIRFGYGYDKAGNIVSWNQQKDSATAGWDWSYRYNGSDQLSMASRVGLGGSTYTDLTEHYAYDDGGNRVSRQSGTILRKETVNLLNQLVGLGGGGKVMVGGTVDEPAVVKVNGKYARMLSDTEFEGEADAQVGTNTFTVEATDGQGNSSGDQQYQFSIASQPVTNLSYDDNGNLVADGTRSFEWDAENRLVKITHSSGATSEFTYDGWSRRVRIVEKNAAGTITETRNFVWEGMRIAEQRNAANAVVRRYFEEGYVDGASLTPAAGDKFYHLKDHLGSIRVVYGTSALAKRLDYSAFGVCRLTSGTSFEMDDFNYTGHYLHRPSGLIFAPYRIYNPDTGRWISRDPLENAEMRQGPNLYSYVANNPVNYWDPYGLEASLVLHRDCDSRDSPGTMYIFEDGVYLGSVRTNTTGYRNGTTGVRPGHYNVLPKNNYEPGDTYPEGQPSVTDPRYPDEPGRAGPTYKPTVRIHGEGPSDACVTVPSGVDNIIKDIMMRNLDRGGTTLDVYHPTGSPRGTPTW